MKLRDAMHALGVLDAIAAGEPVTDKDMKKARAAVDRDLQINMKRSDRSADFFQNVWRRNKT